MSMGLWGHICLHEVGGADLADHDCHAGGSPARAPSAAVGSGEGATPAGADAGATGQSHPTAKALLRAFEDYALVVVHHSTGEAEVHYPKFRPVQQQIWDILGLYPLPG